MKQEMMMAVASVGPYAHCLVSSTFHLSLKICTRDNNDCYTHNTQPFYGSVEFVWENPGEPVPEETFTHYSHRSHQSSLSAFSI